MAKRVLKILLALLMLLCMGGCWDALNIDDRAIITAVLVDYKDGIYSFYVEVANITSKTLGAQTGQGSQSANSSVVIGSGKSFADARTDLDNKLDKPIFLGAVQALVITERMAEYGIEEYALRIRQMQQYRKTMDVVVTPDEPEDFLKIRVENQPLVGFAVEDSLETLKQLGATFHLSLADLLEKQCSRNPCYLLSTISSVEGQIKVIGYTIFCEGKSVGFIPYEESRGIIYMAARESDPRFDYVIPLEDQRVTLEIKLKSIAITPYYDGIVPGFDVSLQFVSNSLYPSSNIIITQDANKTLEQNAERLLCEEIAKTLKVSQEAKCDYLTFSQIFRSRYEDIYDQMIWSEEFPKAWFSIDVSVEALDNDTVDYNPRGLGG